MSAKIAFRVADIMPSTIEGMSIFTFVTPMGNCYQALGNVLAKFKYPVGTDIGVEQDFGKTQDLRFDLLGFENDKPIRASRFGDTGWANIELMHATYGKPEQQ